MSLKNFEITACRKVKVLQCKSASETTKTKQIQQQQNTRSAYEPVTAQSS